MHNDAELTQYVIARLGKHVSRSDLIFEVCQLTGLNWNQAEAFVQQVQDQHRRTIAWKQSPLLLLIGAAILLGGIFLTATASIYFIHIAQTGDPIVLNWQRDYANLGRLVTGIGMTFGSLYGMGLTLRDIVLRA